MKHLAKRQEPGGADTKQNPAAYTKEKLCSMARFRGRADLLTALLTEDGRYTIAAADAAIGRFMKGRN